MKHLAHLPNRVGFRFLGVLMDGTHEQCVVMRSEENRCHYAAALDGTPVSRQLSGWLPMPESVTPVTPPPAPVESEPMKTVSRQTARDDRHDAAAMESHEDMRRDGLTPARRVAIDMEAAALGCTGCGSLSNWNARSDAISAAPDKDSK